MVIPDWKTVDAETRTAATALLPKEVIIKK